MSKPKNKFDVQVVFPDCSIRFTNRKDKEITPQDVFDSLTDFLARVQRVLDKRANETNRDTRGTPTDDAGARVRDDGKEPAAVSATPNRATREG